MPTSTTPFTFDVFLSHNAKDKPRVRPLAERLRAAGLRVWFDEWTIRPGDDIYLAIERGLEDARTLILCLSPAALASDWVGLERSTVLFRDPANAGRRFIPLLLADCNLPDALRRYKYVDFRQEAELGFEELLAACAFSNEGPELSQATKATESMPEAIRAFLDEGRKLANQGRYADARREYESARQEAENQHFSHAAMESRLDLAEIEILEQRDVAVARDGLLDCLRNLSADTEPRNRQVALGLLGDAEILLGRVEEGKSLYREALQLARKRSNRSAEAQSLVGLSHAEELLGNLRSAHSHLDDATELFRSEHREAKGEDARRTAINLGACFSTRASLFRHQSKLTEAIAHLTRAEPLFREANSLDNLGRTLVYRAEILFHEANLDDGFEALQEALSKFESIGNVRWQCRCLDDLAKVLFRDCKYAAALACLERALDLIGSERPELEAVPFLLKSADLCHNHDQKAAADSFITKAKAIAIKNEEDSLIAECLVSEARTLEDTKDRGARDSLFRTAVKHLEAALSKCEVKGRRAEDMRRIGELCGRLGNIREERDWLERALCENEEIGDVSGMGRCLVSLAAAAHEQKVPD